MKGRGMSERKSLDRTRQAVLAAETKYEQLRASVFLGSHDEAVRRFKYPVGKPVPSKILDMIVEASSEVKQARLALDAAREELVIAKEDEHERARSSVNEDLEEEGFRELGELAIAGYEESAADVVIQIGAQVDKVSEEFNALKDRINSSNEDSDRAFWEELLASFSVFNSDLTGYLDQLRGVLRRVRSKPGAAVVKSLIETTRDMRKDGREFAEFSKIKIRGW